MVGELTGLRSKTVWTELYTRRLCHLIPHLLTDGMAFPSIHAVSSLRSGNMADDSASAVLSSIVLAETLLRLPTWRSLPAGVFALIVQASVAGTLVAACTYKTLLAPPVTPASCSRIYHVIMPFLSLYEFHQCCHHLSGARTGPLLTSQPGSSVSGGKKQLFKVSKVQGHTYLHQTLADGGLTSSCCSSCMAASWYSAAAIWTGNASDALPEPGTGLQHACLAACRQLPAPALSPASRRSSVMLMWSRASWLLTCHADCGADLTSWSTSSALRSATPLQLGFAEDCAERLSQDACLLHPFAGLWPGCSISDKSPLPFRRLSSKARDASCMPAWQC